MCFEPGFNIGDVISLIIGGSTLFIALLVYKKLIPSELKKRQLDAVLNLLEHLNAYSFNISSYYHTGIDFNIQTGLSNRNFFNYYKVFKDDKNLESFAELNVLVLNDDIHPFNLSKFIENPLLPKGIANHLAPFINPVLHQCTEEKYKAQDRILVFNEGLDSLPREIQPNKLYITTAFSLLKHRDFIRAISELRAAIENWCKSNNLDELNFREINSRKNF